MLVASMCMECVVMLTIVSANASIACARYSLVTKMHVEYCHIGSDWKRSNSSSSNVCSNIEAYVTY